MKKYLSKSANQTQKIAEILIQALIKNHQDKPNVFALQGNLGAGKTTFMQGIAKALKIKNKILSPTFVIMKNYKINSKNFNQLFHIDCYRFDSPNEITALNFKQIINNPKNLIFIEWPEKIKKFLPKSTVWIKFKIITKNQRQINFN